jgi:protein TonB
MSYLINNQQKMNEIIFSNKNKAYGAYVLRSQYGNTLFKSIGIMSLMMGFIFSLSFYFLNHNELSRNEQIVIGCPATTITEVIFDIDKKKETAASPNPKPKSNNLASTALSTLISDTASVNTNTVLNNSMAVGSTSSSGTGSVINSETITSGGTGTGNSTTESVHMIADSSPEFEGGLKALYEFLGQNLKFPDAAREVGEQGTVHVRFVVDENGKVSSPVALNKVGFGMDEEAIRVISKIPNFKKPGMMKGSPVKVYYTLPIKFRLR